MASNKLNNKLFVLRGIPLGFNIKGVQTSDKTEVKRIIEAFGGVVVSKQIPGVIQLVTPIDGKNYDNNSISIKYPYACIRANALLDKNKYVIGEEDSDDYEEEDSDDNIDDEEAPDFTRGDDEVIIDFLNKNKLHQYILINETYELMAVLPELNKFHPKILRKHFLDDILPSITDFDITEDDIKGFLNCAEFNTGEEDEELNVKVETNDLVSHSDLFEPNTNAPAEQRAAKNLMEGMRSTSNDKTKLNYPSEKTATPPVPMNYYDCVAIINYISSNNCFQNLKNIHMWQNMSKRDALKKFSAEMLKEKFEKTILPKILNYVNDVNPKRLKPFLLYAGKELAIPIDAVKYGLCQILQECNDEDCKYPHDNVKIREEFTKIEDLAILNFIVKKNCFQDLRIIDIWKEMAKQTELRFHSIWSLRHRFKTLLAQLRHQNSNIRSYVTEENLKRFMDNYDKILRDIKALEDAETEKEFTRAEDYAILGFIMEKHCVKDLDQNEVWREMQKHGDLKHHTAEALRKRFENYLLPNVELFNHCLPRKFSNCFLEYRFSKSNPLATKVRDTDTLVKLCLTDGNRETELTTNALQMTGKIVNPRLRQSQKESALTASTSAKVSESLKIFNLKKTLEDKLTTLPPKTKRSLPKPIPLPVSSTASVDSFDTELLKEVVPPIKAMRDRFRKATTSSESEMEVSHPRRVLRPKKNANKRKLNSPEKSPASKLARQTGDQSVSTENSKSNFINILKGKLDKSLALKKVGDEIQTTSTPSTSMKPDKSNKINTKENSKGKPPKRTREKIAVTSESNPSIQSSDTLQKLPSSARTNAHIELLTKAKQGVNEIEEQISKWCLGTRSGHTVHLCVDDLKSMSQKLINLERSLYKAVLAARVEVIVKSPMLTISSDDELELHKYLQLFKNND